ncbi:MAG TPA: ATP-dependent helicase, partial [candidate division CPR3 bacterium]|nr:ATP-dependent helicase [candidate division CPR3 bacterium]
NMVLELLSSFHKSPNLFIVGDEKQAIFRFQGASLENFRYFQEKHPDAKLIRLKKNYRSTQAILDGAGHIMKQAEGSLSSNIAAGEKIEVFEFSTPDVEMFALAQQIKSLIKKGVNASDIAVLFRDNKDAWAVLQMLEKQAIPFILEAEHDVLSDEDIKKLIVVFRSVEEFGSDELLFKVLSLDFWGLDPLSVLKEVRRARDKSITLTEAIRSSRVELLQEISKKMARWHTMAKNQSALDVFDDVVRESGFLAYLLSKSNSYVQMEKLRGLYEEMRLVAATPGRSSLNDFLSYLNVMAENGVSLRKNIKTSSAVGVRLMTAHKAKGREFTYVFLVNAYDGHWGNRKIRQTFLLPERIALATDTTSSEDEEERKLFYVALTRARKKVIISYSKTRLDGRSILPSRFIAEIAEKFRVKGDVSIYENAFKKKGDVLFASVKAKTPDYQEKKFVRELFSTRGLSVSALNNYLSCPWKYFYINLVQIPQSPNRSQLYGTVIHNTLRDFFNILIKEKKASKTYLLSRLKVHALRMFSKKDAKEVVGKGVKALSGYYDAYRKTFNAHVLNELSIQDVVLDDIRLTGKLDKVELGEDKEVNVVDYKTGRVRSRNEIEGKTKTSTGDYKRQLVFYKLLLDNHKKGKYIMKTGELDFVEPSP